MKGDAVRSINFDRIAVHHEKSFLIMDCEKCESAGFIVDAHKMLLVREKIDVLRIITADWEAVLK